ncbi:MAG: hypothetical protein GYA34_17685 [Chloroflexi bacterium]|nr:hypothetical protein [Chloroflexota bacterium]
MNRQSGRSARCLSRRRLILSPVQRGRIAATFRRGCADGLTLGEAGEFFATAVIPNELMRAFAQAALTDGFAGDGLVDLFGAGDDFG